MKNFYAVRVGYTTGIYEDVEDAKDEIRGYSCAEWKGFHRYADALEYMYENPNVTKYYVWEDLVFDEIDIAHQYSGENPVKCSSTWKMLAERRSANMVTATSV